MQVARDVPAGIDEHNCLGQLKDKGIKIDCNKNEYQKFQRKANREII